VLAEFYPLIKMTHIGLALSSGTLFLCRAVGGLLGFSNRVMARPLRRLSVAIDSLLLLAALLLLYILRLDPFAVPWLQAKLGLLVAYIVFGTLALRRARTHRGRTVALILALLSFALMLAIARTHDPLGWLRFLPPL